MAQRSVQGWKEAKYLMHSTEEASLTHLHRGIVPLQDLHHPMEANGGSLLGVAQPVLKPQPN